MSLINPLTLVNVESDDEENDDRNESIEVEINGAPREIRRETSDTGLNSTIADADRVELANDDSLSGLDFSKSNKIRIIQTWPLLLKFPISCRFYARSR